MFDPNSNGMDEEPSVCVIIPAAGQSTRMDMDKRKPWLEIAGEPIIFRTLCRFSSLSQVEEIILVVNEEDLDYARGELWGSLSKAGVSMIVSGGENRAQSVWNALQVTNPSVDVVAVHDAVRPFIDQSTCKSLFKVAADKGAAVPAVPVTDSIKRVEADKITENVRRLGLMAVQTPQCFTRGLLIDAYEYAFSTGGISENITDEASLVEQYGQEVRVILGLSSNLKITCKEDLRMAEAMLVSGLVS